MMGRYLVEILPVLTQVSHPAVACPKYGEFPYANVPIPYGQDTVHPSRSCIEACVPRVLFRVDLFMALNEGDAMSKFYEHQSDGSVVVYDVGNVECFVCGAVMPAFFQNGKLVKSLPCLACMHRAQICREDLEEAAEKV